MTVVKVLSTNKHALTYYNGVVFYYSARDLCESLWFDAKVYLKDINRGEMTEEQAITGLRMRCAKWLFYYRCTLYPDLWEHYSGVPYEDLLRTSFWPLEVLSKWYVHFADVEEFLLSVIKVINASASGGNKHRRLNYLKKIRGLFAG